MPARAGYWGTILWVDLSSRTFRLEERDEIFWRRYVGGGLLATQLLLEKTAPGIDAVGALQVTRDSSTGLETSPEVFPPRRHCDVYGLTCGTL